VFASCDLVQRVDKSQIKKFEKWGVKSYAFHDDEGTHFAQATDNRGKSLVVFLPGYGASGNGQYGGTAKILKDEFDLIFPDLLTFGKSVYNGNDFSIDAQVEHLKLLLDSLHVNRRFTLIGNSYGGVVASFFASKYPAMVEKLVIYDSPVKCYSLNYADSLSQSLGLPNIDYALSPTTPEEVKASLGLVFHKPPYVPRFVRKQMAKASAPLRDQQLRFIADLKENAQWYNDYDLKLKCKTYLVWGAYDFLIPPKTGNCIAETLKIPASRRFVMKEAAHAGNVEFPEEFCDIVRTIVFDR
jgi:pimeloyl-ACP methyl ester carboxylesterase